MDLSLLIPPRCYSVGTDNWVTISDCGSLKLSQGQSVAVGLHPVSLEVTVSRRNWGYQVSLPPSKKVNLCIAGRSPERMHLLMYVPSKEQEFESYLRREKMTRLITFKDHF
jgi:hypothetical protein